MSGRRVGQAALLAAMLAALVPQAAQAHLTASGMGPLYDGVVHFGLSPEDSLPVAALALLAGRRGPVASRLLLGVAPIAWFAGGLGILMSGSTPPAVVMTWATAAFLLIVGGLLAADAPLPPAACAAAALLLGLARGAADMAGASPGPGSVLSLLGMSASVLAIFALIASIALPLRRFWMIVAVRVAGSWLAAVGLLLAGWLLRYGAKAG